MTTRIVPKNDHSKEPIELPKKWSEVLSNQPESGMGYQNVMLKVKGKGQMQGLVLNGQYLMVSNPIKVEDIEDISVINGKNPFGVPEETWTAMWAKEHK